MKVNLRDFRVEIKPGVDVTNLSPEIIDIVPVAKLIWISLGQELVITSGRDGSHKKKSRHYTGEALDFRTRYFTKAETEYAAERLQKRVGNRYFVLVEKTHIHIQITS